MTEYWTIWAAAQPWLNFAGLWFDFVGIVLLAIEWRLALTAEAREAEIIAREERFRPRPFPGRPDPAPHQEVFDDMRARRRVAERISRGVDARARRRSWFALALALIAFGFLLQIAGSAPLA